MLVHPFRFDGAVGNSVAESTGPPQGIGQLHSNIEKFAISPFFQKLLSHGSRWWPNLPIPMAPRDSACPKYFVPPRRTLTSEARWILRPITKKGRFFAILRRDFEGLPGRIWKNWWRHKIQRKNRIRNFFRPLPRQLSWKNSPKNRLFCPPPPTFERYI